MACRPYVKANSHIMVVCSKKRKQIKSIGWNKVIYVTMQYVSSFQFIVMAQKDPYFDKHVPANFS